MQCSLCLSDRVTLQTCPDNPNTYVKDYKNHPSSTKQLRYIKCSSKYLAPSQDKRRIIRTSAPYNWIIDYKELSIATEDGKLRWDTDIGTPSYGNPIILYRPFDNANQKSFTSTPNGGIKIKNRFLTIENNMVVFGENVIEIKFQIVNPYQTFPQAGNIAETKTPTVNPDQKTSPLTGSTTEKKNLGVNPDQKTSHENIIKFVSYNILTGLSFFENDLESIPYDLRTWGLGREKLVKAEVIKADIAVLVECTLAQLGYIADDQSKFASSFAPKIGETDGTAILYDKSRFTFIAKNNKMLTNKGGQIVSNVLLFDTLTKKPICVSGLHLKSGDQQFQEDRRVEEIKEAIDKTLAFIATSGYDQKIAQVISGDLNSDAKYYHTTTDILRSRGYSNVNSGGDKRPTYYYWQKSIYDYIFIKGAIASNSYDVDLITTRCPNGQQGSDHLAVRCNLML